MNYIAYLNQQSEILCCQKKHNSVRKLPFNPNMYLGYYDGPLEGITMCSICHRAYYYKDIDYHTSWYCRIFSFSQINHDFFDLVEYFNVHMQIGSEYYKIQHDFIDHRNIISDLHACPITYMCVADSYIRLGFLEKLSLPFNDVHNWFDYFGIVIDKKSGVFSVNTKRNR